MRSHGIIQIVVIAAALLFGSFMNEGWGRTASNHPPLISGTPPTTVSVGQSYSFVPTASDPDGDRLTFAIINKPGWASFDRKTGRLSGTPAAANVGTTANITIQVSDRVSTTALPPFTISVTAVTPVNHAPVISGTPPTSVRTGSAYSFLPTASDADGDTLTFAIVNKPSWALFNTANGALTGTPAAVDVGTTAPITLSVSDGVAAASLAPFTITVTPDNQATLNWVAPAMREDGTALSLSEIGGFRVYHGLDATTGTLVADIPDATATRFTATGLTAGVHYFAVTAYDTSKAESAKSNVLSRTIQ